MQLARAGRLILIRWIPGFVLGFLVVAIATHIASGEDLKPFKSDGCSAFPDGTSEQKDLWQLCCVAHDYAYWQGGTKQQRLDADEALQNCVSDSGEPGIGSLMRFGVRIGGSPYWPTPFRWGFGWPYPRAYGELSEEELAEIDALSRDAAESPDQGANHDDGQSDE